MTGGLKNTCSECRNYMRAEKINGEWTLICSYCEEKKRKEKEKS